MRKSNKAIRLSLRIQRKGIAKASIPWRRYSFLLKSQPHSKRLLDLPKMNQVLS